ncbi:iron-sulfur cluster assembly scaffold protein [Candidatus Altiarchaeales archaeon WOR_SM1_SCG]|nr:iron-sulfur cluster assembly scaffold protein [Candidatus Altiarchaeales archaeon WOR_SM1_SCG]
MYSEKVIDHFTNPRNAGELKNPDGVGLAGNPVCGDVMKITIKVRKENCKDFIDDVKFKTMGCAAAIATSSMVTELAKGKTINDAMKITRIDISDALCGLPQVKMHCSNLAADALNEAIYDYMSKRNLTIPDDLESRHKKTIKETEGTGHKHDDADAPVDECG